jgi:NAD(P)-dependent dehydrogenase (short-subunit alcohol dehydrogenase family)
MCDVEADGEATVAGSLEGKVAIVTGGGGGIGRAYVAGLVGQGACVVVADLDEAAARRASADADPDGACTFPVRCDIADEADADAAVRTAVDRFGGLDILVNNAAMMAELPHLAVLDHDPAFWSRVFDVNVKGAWLMCRAAVGALRTRGGGSIVNQVSGGAFKPAGLYGATKLALVSLTATLATQLAADGIRVNAIAPGAVNTEAGHKASVPGFRAAMEASVPIPFGEPEDLVGALLFLVGPTSRWVTGQTLCVDGGWNLRL